MTIDVTASRQYEDYFNVALQQFYLSVRPASIQNTQRSVSYLGASKS